MHFKFSFIFVTSVLLPINGMTAEVISFKDSDNNSIHIRTLASSCATCHGTFGNAVTAQGINYTVPPLAGLKAPYFIGQMIAFRSGERKPLIMQRHAKGLTVEEINALGIYFSNQKPILQKPLRSQHFKNNHAQ